MWWISDVAFFQVINTQIHQYQHIHNMKEEQIEKTEFAKRDKAKKKNQKEEKQNAEKRKKEERIAFNVFIKFNGKSAK